MIHITIPSYRVQVDKRDSYKKFTTFDVYINGAFHASVRYSALYQLHEKLVEAFGFRLDVPEFPPKKIWRSLDSKVVNERREALSKYLQGVIQNQDVAKHLIIEKAFLEFQILSFQNSAGFSIPFFTNLEIFLPDGSAALVQCCSSDPTNIIMKRFCELMEINTRNSGAFAFFLGLPRRNSEDSNVFNYVCLRWLKNFEAPYISQQLANKESDGLCHKILIRRVTWDPSVEAPLLDDLGCLRLFYLQALNDVQRKLLNASPAVMEKLQKLQKENNFVQYVRLCHQQPSYGYELLSPVISDFPHPNMECQLKVGRRQLVLEYDEEGMTMQTLLRSTRIRVWRVSHTDQQNVQQQSKEVKDQSEMVFQIEYLIGKQKFGVITLNTSQAVILSLFLQSIAAEILLEQPVCNSPTFKFDDTVSVKAIESLEVSKANSIVSDDLSIRSTVDEDDVTPGGNMSNELFQIISYQMPFNSETFEDIMDDDL